MTGRVVRLILRITAYRYLEKTLTIERRIFKLKGWKIVMGKTALPRVVWRLSVLQE